METATEHVTHTRTKTLITCTRCKKQAHVPFTPTPGRAILCSDCHRKARAAAEARANRPPEPKRPMLSMRRKGHFTHDALRAIQADGDLEDRQKRAFIEMVFARGARQGTPAAIEFIGEKMADGTITSDEGARLADVVHDYSRRQ